LLGEAFGVLRPSLLGEVVKQGVDPGAVLVGDFFDGAAGTGLGLGAYERAPPESRIVEGQSLYLEDSDRPVCKNGIGGPKAAR
jgi:hypothetical protein